MRLTQKHERMSLTQVFTGRKNGITFTISDMKYKNYKWYVLAEITKDKDNCYNSLWGGLEFDTQEEAVEWCENLTKEKLIELRNKYL